MLKPLSISCALALAAATAAQAPQLAISIGLRETGAGGGAFSNIGDNGGSTGGIEWINRDGQTLTLDGTWQQFTFDLTLDPVTAFAGTTANNILEGGFGTLEHIRFLNISGYTGPISVWVDDITNTITPSGGSPTPTVFGSFNSFGDNQEVMFQEPSFSGSTSGNVAAGSTAGIDNYVAARSNSCRANWSFVDNTTTRWMRWTTFATLTQGNPLVRFDQSATISFWLRGGVGQPNLGSNGPGTAIAEMVGDGLNLGQTSTYFTAGALGNTPGVLVVSLDGFPDLPIFGGNLVSFNGGFLFGVGISADPNGAFSLPFAGNSALTDLVLQSAFIDPSQPAFFVFTNAVRAQFGRP
ncbi:MAG: hypothetical protein AB7I19_07520 [Planctomycetota bacterium]